MSLHDVKYPPSEVILFVQEATSAFRKVCSKEDRCNLFLHVNGVKKRGEVDQPVVPLKDGFEAALKDLILRASDGKWKATGSAIRNSLLLLKSMKKGVKVAQKAAQHKSARTTCQHYSEKFAQRLKYDDVMREFKLWLETLVTLGIEDAAVKLGIDEDAYAERVLKIQASSFGGIVCHNSRDGTQKGTIAGVVCNKIAHCLTCKNKGHLFIVSEQNVMHLLQWHEALKEAIDDGRVSTEQPHWWFWFKFMENMIDNLQSSRRNTALLVAANNRVAVEENPYLQINFKEVV